MKLGFIGTGHITKAVVEGILGSKIKFKKIDNRIKIFKNSENIGLTKSLNILISESTGRYIARQDADDISNKKRFETQINFLTKNDIQICSTYVEKSKNYLDINYSKPSAIVIGKESSSLTSVWRNKSDELISIPMKGKMDSLNLSVCAAIVIFEGLKQRDDN